MDQELLRLFTKIKMLGKKVMNRDVDILLLSSDKNYAANTLRLLSNADDPELVTAAIETMDRLGLLSTTSPDGSESGASGDKKYIHTLR